MLLVNRFIKIIVLILTGAFLSFTGISYANSISFYCQAGYVCEFQVIYDYHDYKWKSWTSHGFPLAQTRVFNVPQGAEVAWVYAYVNGSYNYPIKSFPIQQPGDYKGKMWGTIFSPNACLALNGAGCV